MKRATRAMWRACRTLDDLGGMYARWLLREVDSQPYYMPGDGPDEETLPLIPTLVALNRAGFATVDSQPGALAPGWTQRAAVQGWADTLTLGRLQDALADTRFQVLATTIIPVRGFDPFNQWAAPGVPVTFNEGRPVAWFGVQLSRMSIRDMYDGAITAAMVDVITAAWNVTVFDPKFNDNELWPALDRAAEHLAGMTL